MSPELTRNVDDPESHQEQLLPSRCYNHSPSATGYNNHPSQGGTIGAGLLEPVNELDALTYAPRYAPPYTTPPGRQDSCSTLRLDDYRTIVDDQATIVPETFRIYHTANNQLSRLPSYHGERASRRVIVAGDAHSSVPDLQIAGEVASSATPREAYGTNGTMSNREEQCERYRRGHGGSLKRRTSAELQFCKRLSYFTPEFLAAINDSGNSRNQRNWSGGSMSRQIEPLKETTLGSCTPRRSRVEEEQTNPSENVILDQQPITSDLNNLDEANASAATNADTDVQPESSWRTDVQPESSRRTDVQPESSWRTRRHEHNEKRRRRVPSPGSRATIDVDDVSVINNHESKHNKLDRSKSLD